MNTYTFARPYKADGTPTKWKQVVDYIVANGSVSKHMIIKEVWPEAGKWIVERGWCSTLFSALNKRHPDVRYNVHTKEWESTAYAHKEIEKQHKKIIRNSKYGVKDVADSFFGELHSMMDKLPLPKAEQVRPTVKVLAENYNASHCSVTIMKNVDGRDTRFKLVSSNGNCYFHASIKMQTVNGDYAEMYNESDIPGLISIAYYHAESDRIPQGKANIQTLISFVNKVF